MRKFFLIAASAALVSLLGASMILSLFLLTDIAEPQYQPTAGNPPITPAWAFEHWVWEDNINTQESTEALVEGYRSRGIPVGAVIVDSPWETAYNTLQWDASRYPAPQAMIDDFRSAGVRTMLWITGYVNTDSPDFEFVKQQGYGVNDGEVSFWWKGNGIHIDFTNPDALDWWHGRMDTMLDMGIAGWKVDMSAHTIPIPFWRRAIDKALEITDTGFHLEMRGKHIPGDPLDTYAGSISRQEFKSRYYGDFLDYTRSVNSEGITLARPYTRSEGFSAPVSKLTMGWVGDQSGDWDGLHQQLDNVYRSAEAGYGAVGAEIGGYNGTEPSKKTLIRWAQLGAMLPLMENGGSNGGLTNHLPWFHDQETVDIYRYFATLHTELAPYTFSYGVEAHLTGESIIRDPNRSQGQHMLGEQILVSVLDSESDKKTVRFPDGENWIDFWDHRKTHEGGTEVTLDVPLHQYPIFIKSGAIIPMRIESDLTGIGDAASANKETILIFPNGKSRFTYHMPTGDGVEFSDAIISVDEESGTVTIDSSLVTAYRIKVMWPSEPARVVGADLWKYDRATGIITVDARGTEVSLKIEPP